MKTFRSKLAIAAVIFGLGGLGGFAMASNPAGQTQVPSAAIASQTGQAGAHVSTGTSGAATSGATSTLGINAPASQVLPRSTTNGGGQDD